MLQYTCNVLSNEQRTRSGQTRIAPQTNCRVNLTTGCIHSQAVWHTVQKHVIQYVLKLAYLRFVRVSLVLI